MRPFGRLKSLARELKDDLKTYQFVLKDDRTPRLARILLGLAVGYALLPFDIIPDFIPVIGHMDDVIIPSLVILALKMIPQEVLEDCKLRARAAQDGPLTPMETEKLKIAQVLKEFAEKLPRFPDGRIDYSHLDKAPVLTCIVKFQDKIILLKRSDRVRTYQGKWNTVAGYLDELKPIREKALEVVKEELGITQKDILQVKLGSPYEFSDPDAKKPGSSTRCLSS